MRKHVLIGVVCVALAAAVTGAAEAGQAPAPSKAATKAAKASPDLVGELSKELGSSPEQAAGAAGALFGLAKSRLQPDEFKQVSNVVPGMSSLLSAAPSMSGTKGTSGSLSQLAGQASGLMAVASAFSKLGIPPELVAKAVPVLTSFVSKAGGANVASLLAGVLK